MKGKIWYWAAAKQMEMAEKDVPKPGPGAVLTKIRLCNICGSDVKDWANTKNHSTNELKKPCTVGHEFVSEIIELGEGVTCDSAGAPLAEGDRIIAPYFLTCMKCSRCAEGDFANCERAYENLGKHHDVWPHFHGAFATHYYFHPTNMIYKVPEDLDDRLVVGVNCAFTQVYAGLEKINLRYGETLVIQGAGGLGLYAACIANETGAKTIVIDNLRDRLQLAKSFGAAHIIDMNEFPSAEDRVKEVMRLTGKGTDCAIEVSGHPAAFEEGLRFLRINGRYATIGNNLIGNEATFSPGYITRKSLAIHGVVRYKPSLLLKSLEFLQKTKDKYPYTELSPEIYPLDDIQSIIAQCYDRKIVRAALKP